MFWDLRKHPCILFQIVLVISMCIWLFNFRRSKPCKPSAWKTLSPHQSSSVGSFQDGSKFQCGDAESRRAKSWGNPKLGEIGKPKGVLFWGPLVIPHFGGNQTSSKSMVIFKDPSKSRSRSTNFVDVYGPGTWMSREGSEDQRLGSVDHHPNIYPIYK